MPLFARAVMGLLTCWAARGGFWLDASEDSSQELRQRQTGVRGETFAYWYLRRRGYVVVGRNYRVAHRRGEIDLIGWDGPVLAFVEVKTRSADTSAPPEQAVDAEKQRLLQGMARDYLSRRRLTDVSYRFDVLALEARPGAAPLVRLHKGAFGPG